MGMTPAELEERLSGLQDGATVATVVDALRADPHWRVTTIALGVRVVRIDLVYRPTGEAYTLRARRGHRLPDDDDDDRWQSLP